MASPNMRVDNDGNVFIPALGRSIKLVNYRQGQFYDTVRLPSTAPGAGTSLEFFRDIQGKNLPHTNVRTPRRIPAGTEFICTRIGVLVLQAFGNEVARDDDIIKAIHGATLKFSLNDRLIAEGPLHFFPCGYGATGTTTRTGTGIVTNGLASVGASPKLLVEQPVSDTDDLIASINFLDASWGGGQNNSSNVPTFTQQLAFQLILEGFVKKPFNK